MQKCSYCDYETDGVVELEHSEQECMEMQKEKIMDPRYDEWAGERLERLTDALQPFVEHAEMLMREHEKLGTSPADAPAGIAVPVNWLLRAWRAVKTTEPLGEPSKRPYHYKRG